MIVKSCNKDCLRFVHRASLQYQGLRNLEYIERFKVKNETNLAEEDFYAAFRVLAVLAGPAIDAREVVEYIRLILPQIRSVLQQRSDFLQNKA